MTTHSQAYLDHIRALPTERPDVVENRLRKGCAQCPAARHVSVNGLECAIEQQFITPHGDPKTIARFCTEDYTLCPTWRRHWHEQRTAQEHADKMRKDAARQEDQDNEALERFSR